MQVRNFLSSNTHQDLSRDSETLNLLEYEGPRVGGQLPASIIDICSQQIKPTLVSCELYSGLRSSTRTCGPDAAFAGLFPRKESSSRAVLGESIVCDRLCG